MNDEAIVAITSEAAARGEDVSEKSEATRPEAQTLGQSFIIITIHDKFRSLCWQLVVTVTPNGHKP